jgi:predicted LPLAT superfamily acyltransferase
VSNHWSGIREAGALTGLRIMVRINRIFGRTVFGIVLVPIMTYFFIRRGVARRASKDYLKRLKKCYPEIYPRRPLTWLSFRHFLAFGHALLDKILVWVDTPSGIKMDPDDEKYLFQAVASGKGSLVIGSHFGNLEYSRAISARHPGLVINVLMYDLHARNFGEVMAETKPDSRMNLIQVTDVDLELALLLKEKVKKGEWVVIAGDRVPIGEQKRTCEAQFLGEKARFPVGPYVLANLLGCPVYLLHCFRIEDDYHVSVEFFEDDFQVPRKNRQQIYEKEAQKFAASLERQVVRSPLQWFNFYDFWHSQDSPRDKTERAAS